MNYEQVFVGSTSIVLGLFSLAAGLSNREIFFQPRKIKWIEKWGGRPLARATYALLGAALIGLGIAIAMGFAPNAGAST